MITLGGISKYYQGGGGAIPVVVSAVSIAGTAVVGQTLTVSYTITGTPTVITRRWYRGATLIFTSTSSDTYVLTQAEAGNTSNITCNVDADGVSNATSNTIAQVLDADLNATLLRGIALGYTIPTSIGIEKLNTFIIAGKVSGAWQKSDVIYIPATDGGDSNYATLNYKAPTLHQLTLVNSPTYTDKLGYTYVATAQIPLNFNPATNGVNFTRNNAAVFLWTFSGANVFGAATDGGAIRINQGTGALRINDGTGGALAITGTGLRGVARVNNAFRKSYINGVVGADIAAASIAVASETLILYNSNGAIGGGGCSFIFVGASIDAELAAFHTALSNYLTSL